MKFGRCIECYVVTVYAVNDTGTIYNALRKFGTLEFVRCMGENVVNGVRSNEVRLYCGERRMDIYPSNPTECSGGCFTNSDGLSDSGQTILLWTNNMGRWSVAQSDSPSLLVKQPPESSIAHSMGNHGWSLKYAVIFEMKPW